MGWIIAGSILLVILILLLCTVTVTADYKSVTEQSGQDGGEETAKEEPKLYLKIAYLCFTIFKLPAKELTEKQQAKKVAKEKKKAAKKAAKEAEKKSKEEAEKAEKEAENADGETAKDEKKKKPKLTFDEILDLVRMVLDSLGKPLKKLLKRTTFSHLSLDILCGGEDAAKAAINYGTTNILLSAALNLIDVFFTLKAPDNLRVDVDFYKEKTELSAYCEIRLSLLAALAFAFALVFRFIGHYAKHREARRAMRKLTGKKSKKKTAKSAAN